MAKDTQKIVEELKLCPNFQTFYREHQDDMVSEELSALLNRLLQQHDLKKSQVIRMSELSETYSYQIFSGLRIPERRKLLCLAIAMQLTLPETQALLKSAGYAPLYVKLPFDSIVIYGICKHRTVAEINELLFDYELETLG